MLQYTASLFKIIVVGSFLLMAPVLAQQKFSTRQIQKLKNETLQKVEAKHKNTQVMIDKVFSFAELGFQEYESSAYLTAV